MFLMALGIQWTFGFVDYEFEERRGSDKDSHFGCIIYLLLIHFLIYYNSLILLFDFIINCY